MCSELWNDSDIFLEVCEISNFSLLINGEHDSKIDFAQSNIELLERVVHTHIGLEEVIIPSETCLLVTGACFMRPRSNWRKD